MKRFLTGKTAFLAVPAAAGVLVLATAASASASTLPSHGKAPVHKKPAPVATLSCSAWASSTNSWDHTTDVDVSTTKGASVTGVASYRNGHQTRTATANRSGDAVLAYQVGNIKRGERVNVAVTVTEGWQRASCSTSFTVQK